RSLMRIGRVHIVNFRCFQDFTLLPTPGVNVLVGGNNSGKSTLLLALNRVLGRGAAQFDLDDFYSTQIVSDPTTLPLIRLDIELRPAAGAPFSDSFIGEFAEDIDFGPDEGQ